MLHERLLSMIGFRKPTPAEQAIANYVKSISNAPKILKTTLLKDIEFIFEILGLDEITSGEELEVPDIDEEIDTGKLIDKCNFDPDSTVIPDSEEQRENKLDTKTGRGNRYYTKEMLVKLLTATANYQGWLKVKLRKRPDDSQRELMEYLSNRSMHDLQCFPEYISGLVENIEESSDDGMSRFYHTLLVNCLIELKEEIS